jgi:hypothetical protein
VGSGVVAADADVVKSSVVAQGQAAGVIDAVASDPVVGVEAFAGSGFGPGGVDGGWGGAPGASSRADYEVWLRRALCHITPRI